MQRRRVPTRRAVVGEHGALDYRSLAARVAAAPPRSGAGIGRSDRVTMAPERRRLRRSFSACSPRRDGVSGAGGGSREGPFLPAPGRGADRERGPRPPRPHPATAGDGGLAVARQAPHGPSTLRRRSGRRRAHRVVVRHARASPPGGPHACEPLVGGGELLHRTGSRAPTSCSAWSLSHTRTGSATPSSPHPAGASLLLRPRFLRRQVLGS
jgi:hypothetical protein